MCLFQRPYSPQAGRNDIYLQHDVGLFSSPFGSTVSVTSAPLQIITRCIMCLNIWTTTRKAASNLSCISQNLQFRDMPPATRWHTYCSHLRGAVTEVKQRLLRSQWTRNEGKYSTPCLHASNDIMLNVLYCCNYHEKTLVGTCLLYNCCLA